jgi:hypothetical protein
MTSRAPAMRHPARPPNRRHRQVAAAYSTGLEPDKDLADARSDQRQLVDLEPRPWRYDDRSPDLPGLDPGVVAISRCWQG